MIQNWEGGNEYEKEGVASKTTHLLFCNRTLSETDGTATDIRYGDRIEDELGNRYRVEFVEDAAGQGHHYEVQLKALSPGEGDPTPTRDVYGD